MAKDNRKKMKNFEFSYDSENDDLFVYLKGEKSVGAVELGNFVFDFDKKRQLVAFEIIDASETLSKLLSKMLEISKIREMKAELVNFRNMASIRISIDDDNATIVIPNIKRESSPALSY